MIDSGFRDGQYHGKVVMYYFKTDQKKSEGTYDSGVAVGKWRFWNEDGTVALDTVLFSK